MEKKYELPPIVWLKMTDYMHGWLQCELGCECRVKDQRVICVQHLPGARDILRMEAYEDLTLGPMKVVNVMSATRKNMLAAGLVIDEDIIREVYGLTKDLLKLFVPVECPKMCLTKYGILRPWSLDVSLGRQQASELQRLLRKTFWQAVEDFNTEYARKMDGKRYPAIDMIEEFCAKTQTPEVYAEAIRREWQRRLKNGQSRHIVPEKKMVYGTMADL